MTADAAWNNLLLHVLMNGVARSPRGFHTLDTQHTTLRMDMRYPVVCNKMRRLSYTFMAAEAFWILDGDNRVKTIAPFNKNIAQFSDDDITFFGAYGPPIKQQLHYVVDKIQTDTDTRQAGLTIWRQNPPSSRDIPCTIAVWFRADGPLLHTHVFMRSSDIWLGVPYDVFNFSMLTHLVCCRLNDVPQTNISPGTLYLTSVSSHLYDRDKEGAENAAKTIPVLASQQTPEPYYYDEALLMGALSALRFTKPGEDLRWWEKP